MKKMIIGFLMMSMMMAFAQAAVTFEDDFNDLSQWDSTPSHCYAYDGFALLDNGYYYSQLSSTSPSVLTRTIDMSNLTDWRITTIAKVSSVDYFTFFMETLQENCNPSGYTEANYIYSVQVEPYYGSEDVYVRMGADGVNCIGSLPPTPLPAFTTGVNHNYTQEKIGDVWSFYMDGVFVANASLVCNTPSALTQFQLLARDEGFTKIDYVKFEQFAPTTCSNCTCTPLWNPSAWGSCVNNGTGFFQSRSYADLNNCGQPTPPNDVRTCGKANNHYGRTTDFQQVDDPTNVKHAIYETPSGYIMWENSIDITGVDFDKAIIIAPDLLFVNKSLTSPSMDTPALVSFQMDRTQDWCVKGFQLYYAEDAYSDIKQLAQAYAEGKATKQADKSRIGLNCYNASICRDVTCTNSLVGFRAMRFSGFGFEGNYSADYSADDIAPIVIDGIGKFAVIIVSFVTLIAMFLLYGWAKGKFF